MRFLNLLPFLALVAAQQTVYLIRHSESHRMVETGSQSKRCNVLNAFEPSSVLLLATILDTFIVERPESGTFQ